MGDFLRTLPGVCAIYGRGGEVNSIGGKVWAEHVSSQAGYQTGDGDLSAFVRVLADTLQYMPSMSEGPICYHTSTVYFWTGNYQGSTVSVRTDKQACYRVRKALCIMEAVIPLTYQKIMANIART